MKIRRGAADVVRLRAAAFAGALAVLVSAIVAARSPLAAAFRRGEPVAGMLLGTDLAENAPHSDTLMVWRYDPRAVRLDVLSIPRDTKIDLPGYRFRRINEVFAYHYAATRDVSAAAQRLMDAVGALLPSAGVLDPRFFFQVDYRGFRRMIDSLGGVAISVDEPMHYDDDAGNYHFHKDPGVYQMNGGDALGYVRYRGKSGDRGRILRQMEFLRALARRGTSPAVFWRCPGALAEAAWAVRSNLRAWELPFLVAEMKRLRAPDINPWLLPGRPRGAYWEMDGERAAFVLAQMTGSRLPAEGRVSEAPADEDAFEAEDGSGGSAAARAAEPVFAGGPHDAPAAGRSATVKVWNASGRAGLALSVARRLRGAGFDVIEWGNYVGRQNKSRVVDRSGHFERARAVAERLGLLAPYSDADPALRVDVEVVLGEDFAGRIE